MTEPTEGNALICTVLEDPLRGVLVIKLFLMVPFRRNISLCLDGTDARSEYCVFIEDLLFTSVPKETVDSIVPGRFWNHRTSGRPRSFWSKLPGNFEGLRLWSLFLLECWAEVDGALDLPRDGCTLGVLSTRLWGRLKRAWFPHSSSPEYKGWTEVTFLWDVWLS